MSRRTSHRWPENAPNTFRGRTDQLTGQIACAGAAIAYLCLGVIVLVRQPLSGARLALGVAGVCVVSLGLAYLGHCLRPDERQR